MPESPLLCHCERSEESASSASLHISSRVRPRFHGELQSVVRPSTLFSPCPPSDHKTCYLDLLPLLFSFFPPPVTKRRTRWREKLAGSRPRRPAGGVAWIPVRHF